LPYQLVNFLTYQLKDPWSAKCSGRITIRLFKRIVDRGQWIEERGKVVCHSYGTCPRESGEQESRKKLKTQPRLAELGGVTDEKWLNPKL